jgi:hypothetical protein
MISRLSLTPLCKTPIILRCIQIGVYIILLSSFFACAQQHSQSLAAKSAGSAYNAWLRGDWAASELMYQTAFKQAAILADSSEMVRITLAASDVARLQHNKEKSEMWLQTAKEWLPRTTKTGTHSTALKRQILRQALSFQSKCPAEDIPTAAKNETPSSELLYTLCQLSEGSKIQITSQALKSIENSQNPILWMDLAHYYLLQKDWELSLQWSQKALNRARQAQSPSWVEYTLRMRALYYSQTQPEMAQMDRRAALAIRQELGLPAF